ncbi:unnamed protein product [Adineta ricciae]|uniref:Uncharacterized protein n=1 Tax=Adineta ricciae TaxID=249248 RepID=A0A815YMB5_ADIRI|nr:unnamed protein product [Adineta ricciae]
MTIPDGTMANALMVNHITDKSAACFSYVIQPMTPNVFGTDIYDEDQVDDKDEFFLTSGGIVHSCPNIYEISFNNEHRKQQSCEDLMSVNDNLNTYTLEVDRYVIRPRFQPISTFTSTDSLTSEIKLYTERHIFGFPSRYDVPMPTTWKSDTSLWFSSPFRQRIPIETKQRSYSYEILLQ